MRVPRRAYLVRGAGGAGRQVDVLVSVQVAAGRKGQTLEVQSLPAGHRSAVRVTTGPCQGRDRGMRHLHEASNDSSIFHVLVPDRQAAAAVLFE